MTDIEKSINQIDAVLLREYFLNSISEDIISDILLRTKNFNKLLLIDECASSFNLSESQVILIKDLTIESILEYYYALLAFKERKESNINLDYDNPVQRMARDTLIDMVAVTHQVHKKIHKYTVNDLKVINLINLSLDYLKESEKIQIALMQEKPLNDVLKSYINSVEINPGSILIEIKDYLNANEYYEEQIKKDPKNIDIWLRYGTVKRKIEDRREFLKSLIQVVILDVNRYNILVKEIKEDEYRWAHQELLNNKFEYEELLSLSNAITNTAIKIEFIEKSLIINPEDSKLRIEQAILFNKIGHQKDSIMTFTDALQYDINKFSEFLQFLKKNITEYKKQYESAIIRSISKLKNEIDYKQWILYGNYLEKNYPKQSISTYKNAVKLEPSLDKIYVKIANIQSRLGNENDHILNIIKAIKLNKKHYSNINSEIKKSTYTSKGITKVISDVLKCNLNREQLSDIINTIETISDVTYLESAVSICNHIIIDDKENDSILIKKANILLGIIELSKDISKENDIIDSYISAIEIDKKNLKLLTEKLKTHFSSKSLSSIVQRILNINLTSQQYLNIGNILRNRKQLKDASLCYLKAIDITDNDSTWLKLGDTYWELNNTPKFIDAYTEGIKQNSKNIKSLEEYISNEKFNKKIAKSLIIKLLTVRLHKTDLNILQDLLIKYHYYEEAITVNERSIEVKEDDTTWKINADLYRLLDDEISEINAISQLLTINKKNFPIIIQRLQGESFNTIPLESITQPISDKNISTLVDQLISIELNEKQLETISSTLLEVIDSNHYKKAAISCVEKAIEINEKDTQHLRKAEIYYSLSDFNMFVKSQARAIFLNKSNISKLLNKLNEYNKKVINLLTKALIEINLSKRYGIQTDIDIGDKLFQLNHYSNSLRFYNNVIKTNPKYDKVYIKKAKVFHKQNKENDEINCLITAIDLNNKNITILRDILSKQLYGESGVQTVVEYLISNKDLIQTYEFFADILSNSTNDEIIENSILLYQAYYNKYEKNFEIVQKVANNYLSIGKEEESIDFIINNISLFPKEIENYIHNTFQQYSLDSQLYTLNELLELEMIVEDYINYGYFSTNNDYNNQAIKFFNNALNINRNLDKVWLAKAYIYIDFNEKKYISSMIEACKIKSENLDKFLDGAKTLANSEKLDFAIEACTEMSKLADDSYDVWILKSILEFNNELHAESLSSSKKANKLKNTFESYDYICENLIILGIYQDAAKIANEGANNSLLSVSDRKLLDNKQNFANALWAYQLKEKSLSIKGKKSLDVAKKAFELQPTDPQIIGNYADILYSERKYPEAIDNYNSAIKYSDNKYINLEIELEDKYTAPELRKRKAFCLNKFKKQDKPRWKLWIKQYPRFSEERKEIKRLLKMIK